MLISSCSSSLSSAMASAGTGTVVVALACDGAAPTTVCAYVLGAVPVTAAFSCSFSEAFGSAFAVPQTSHESADGWLLQGPLPFFLQAVLHFAASQPHHVLPAFPRWRYAPPCCWLPHFCSRRWPHHGIARGNGERR